MGSHRRKWGRWLVMVLAVAVAAGLFIHRCTNYPSGQPDASAPAGASSVPSDSAVSAPVILDTVYVEIAEKEKVPIVRDQPPLVLILEELFCSAIFTLSELTTCQLF